MQRCVFATPRRLRQRLWNERRRWGPPPAVSIAVLLCLALGSTPGQSRLLKSCSAGGPAPDYRLAVRDNWDAVSRLFGRYLGWSPTPDSGRQLKKAMLELSGVADDGVRSAVDSVNDEYRERYFTWLKKCQSQTLGR